MSQRCWHRGEAEAAALFLEDDELGLLKVVAADGYGLALLEGEATYEKGWGITGKVWETGDSVRCNSHGAMLRHKWRKGLYDKKQWPPRTRCENLLFVALRRNDEVFGVLKVENKKREGCFSPFTDEDQDLLEAVASAIALGVQYALLTERRISRSNQNEFIASALWYSTNTHELFLNIDSRHENGPEIIRDGCTAARMYVTTWFRRYPAAWNELHPKVRQKHGTMARFLASLSSRAGSTDPNEWPRGLSVEQHLDQIRDRHKGVQIVTVQGAGDLTMNLHTLGILDGKLYVTRREPQAVRSASDPRRNVYSCLVKTSGGGGGLSIRDLVVDYSLAPVGIRDLATPAGTEPVRKLKDILLAVSGVVFYIESRRFLIRDSPRPATTYEQKTGGADGVKGA